MTANTGAEKYLERRRSEPGYRDAYETASRRVGMFDAVVSALDERRTELGITKAELARRADIPAAAIRRLFSQQHKNPTLTSLVAIADALDVSLTVAADEYGLFRRESEKNGTVRLSGTTASPVRASGIRRRTA